jgi:hypothetical protein
LVTDRPGTVSAGLEHGTRDPETNVTGDNLGFTGKIAWAHLKEIRDYYTRLDLMEAEAENKQRFISAK